MCYDLGSGGGNVEYPLTVALCGPFIYNESQESEILNQAPAYVKGPFPEGVTLGCMLSQECSYSSNSPPTSKHLNKYILRLSFLLENKSNELIRGYF